MASAAKFGTRREISPEIKSWIDKCIVPLLVKEYLAEFESSKKIAPYGSAVAVSGANDGLSAERVTL
jgi:hypothetical protein